MSDSAISQQQPGVWYFSGDLMFAGQVRHAAEHAGLVFNLLSRWPQTPPSSPRFIVVDLATKSGGAAEIAAQAKSHYPDVPCFAFGPHVQVERLKMARAAGFDPVLTRSQFDASLSSLFTQDE